MKMIKMLIASSILVAGAASAITVDQVSSSANVNVKVENGVATLWGNVDSNFEKIQAGIAAAKIEGVERVQNNIFFTN